MDETYEMWSLQLDWWFEECRSIALGGWARHHISLRRYSENFLNEASRRHIERLETKHKASVKQRVVIDKENQQMIIWRKFTPIQGQRREWGDVYVRPRQDQPW